MKKQDNSKKMLFEAMHKVTGMPLKEENYSDHLDTNYSADGMDDYNADKNDQQEAEKLYDTGQKLFSQGRKEEAEKYRQEALKKSSSLGWGETELPPYTTQMNEENGTLQNMDDIQFKERIKEYVDNGDFDSFHYLLGNAYNEKRHDLISHFIFDFDADYSLMNHLFNELTKIKDSGFWSNHK